jgi:hypothetical protein
MRINALMEKIMTKLGESLLKKEILRILNIKG